MSCFENIEYKEDDFLLLNPLTIESDQINLLKDEQEPNLPKLDTPLVDINCDYFKIKNNLSELKTQFQKSEARKNLGIDNSLSSTSKVTYSELVALRDKASLVAGMKYRITDYTTTTTQGRTKSAGNQFDVIVEAVSENELSELAKATQHDGDTYFDGNDLSAWQLWYDLDNDTTKYEWADAENGKGVIYRMIDEKRNDCPYDFKNILFFRNYTPSTTSDSYYYTFSYVVGGVLYDGTVEKKIPYCYNNSIGIYKYASGEKLLNRNVFMNVNFTDECLSNTFGRNCYSNTFRDYCQSNTFGSGCNSNVFEAFCHSNTFGDNCHDNTFGRNCYYNIFGRGCNYNTFEAGLQYITLNSDKTSITLNEEYYDDGTNALVPIKHPDLSTQPSILPYKFMGQYVYEQLIPIELKAGSWFIPKDAKTSIPLFDMSILEVSILCKYEGKLIPLSAKEISYRTEEGIYLSSDTKINGIIITHNYNAYAHIVYTSMPEEGGYYYNSESKKGILIKINLLDTTPINLYNGYVSIEPVMQGQAYYYDIPDDYKADYSGIHIESTIDIRTSTIEYSIPDIGEAQFIQCDDNNNINLEGLINKAKQYLVIITIG